MTDDTTATTTDAVASVHAHTPAAIRRAVGARLQACREALDLKRSAVAVASGYRNLSKGSRRVADREKGIVTPLVDEDGYYACLQVDPDEFRAAFARADDIEARIQQLGWDVTAAERQLLARHAGLLLRSAATIGKEPLLATVRSPAVAVRILWAGGGSLSLGTLTRAWAAGALVADTDEHGPVYLFEGAGSALSGSGRCTGVDRSGALRQVRGAPTRFLGREGPRPGPEASPPSPLSLADALAMLGAKVPESRFHRLDADARPDAEPLAVYDPNTRRLRTANGETWALDTKPSADVSIRPVHGGVSVSGGPARPLQVGPGWHLGAFKEDRMEHACGLRLVSGRVEGPGGACPLKVVGPSPPLGVLPVLAAILRQASTASNGRGA